VKSDEAYEIAAAALLWATGQVGEEGTVANRMVSAETLDERVEVWIKEARRRLKTAIADLLEGSATFVLEDAVNYCLDDDGSTTVEIGSKGRRVEVSGNKSIFVN